MYLKQPINPKDEWIETHVSTKASKEIRPEILDDSEEEARIGVTYVGNKMWENRSPNMIPWIKSSPSVICWYKYHQIVVGGAKSQGNVGGGGSWLIQHEKLSGGYRRIHGYWEMREKKKEVRQWAKPRWNLQLTVNT